MRTQENNKTIAEFMGIKVRTGISVDGSLYYYWNNPEMEDDESIPDYDCDWNELMKVVEKISSIKFKYGRFVPKIVTLSRESYCRIESPSKAFRNSTYNEIPLIKATYNTILEFINWYNNHNKH